MLFISCSNTGGNSGLPVRTNNTSRITEFVGIILVFSASISLIITNHFNSDARLYVIYACSMAFIVFFIIGWYFESYSSDIYKKLLLISAFIAIILNYLLFFVYYNLNINDYNDSIFVYYMLKIFEFMWEFEIYNFYEKSLTFMLFVYFVIGLVSIWQMYDSLKLFEYSSMGTLLLLIVYLVVIYFLW